MPRKKEFYEIPQKFWDAFQRIEQIADDKKREEAIAKLYVDDGDLSCFCPHKMPTEIPEGADEYDYLNPKAKKAFIKNTEQSKMEDIWRYRAYRDKVVIDNLRNKRFVKEVLIPAYTRLGMDDYVLVCNQILEEHEEGQKINLDDIPKLYGGAYD